MINRILLLSIGLICFIQCTDVPKGPLPKIGRHEVSEDGDTIFHRIPEFNFISQDSILINNRSLKDNIYVADFFFMSCPTICPKVKKQMLRIHEKFKDDEIFKLVSHTIDPERDTPSRLRSYAENLGATSDNWLFLNGPKDNTYEIADSYFIAAFEDPDAPGGFDHSGKIVLVDKEGHVRAFAEGTDPAEVDRLMIDIKRLMSEYE